MGNYTTKEKDFRTWGDSNDPTKRRIWVAWEKKQTYMREVRGKWKPETELMPRLRRLNREDLEELNGLVNVGIIFSEANFQDSLDTFPGLDLYFLIKRDMNERLSKQSPSSSSTSSRDRIEQQKKGSLVMLPELAEWLYTPGDSIAEFNKRLELWAYGLEIYEEEQKNGPIKCVRLV